MTVLSVQSDPHLHWIYTGQQKYYFLYETLNRLNPLLYVNTYGACVYYVERISPPKKDTVLMLIGYTIGLLSNLQTLGE